MLGSTLGANVKCDAPRWAPMQNEMPTLGSNVEWPAPKLGANVAWPVLHCATEGSPRFRSGLTLLMKMFSFDLSPWINTTVILHKHLHLFVMLVVLFQKICCNSTVVKFLLANGHLWSSTYIRHLLIRVAQNSYLNVVSCFPLCGI